MIKFLSTSSVLLLFLPFNEFRPKQVFHQCLEVLVDVTAATSATCRVMQFLDARFENLMRRDVNSATLNVVKNCSGNRQEQNQNIF